MNQPAINEKKAIIVSDLHIGSRFFLHECFEYLLSNLSRDHELILNGDIVDNPYARLNSVHKIILDLIKQASYHQKVIWVKGNHDNGFVPEGFEKVRFSPLYNIGNSLLIAHGDNFDGIMPRNQAFMKAFKFMHDLRVKLGARPVHVANYAKKWGAFYRVLRRNVMMNAVNCAKENGYAAVTCGHTHYPEDKVIKGIRYVNTGAWTESPVYYLHINHDGMALRRINEQRCTIVGNDHNSHFK